MSSPVVSIRVFLDRTVSIDFLGMHANLLFPSLRQRCIVQLNSCFLASACCGNAIVNFLWPILTRRSHSWCNTAFFTFSNVRLFVDVVEHSTREGFMSF